MESIIPLALPLVIAGLFAGFMAGLLGVGGGLITVPILFLTFSSLSIGGEWTMHMAVATSLAIIIPTSMASARAHQKKDGIDGAIVRQWWLPIVIFAALGAQFAEGLKTETLVIFFACLTLLMGLKMLLPLDDVRLREDMPTSPLRFIAPSFIGFFSAVMGIGGGLFSVPYLTLFGVPVRSAVGTAAMIGLFISALGAAGFFYAGQGNQALPEWSLGFIYLPAWLIVAPLSVAMAPFGAVVAHRIPKRSLSMIFGGFLLVSTGRMIYLTFFT